MDPIWWTLIIILIIVVVIRSKDGLKNNEMKRMSRIIRSKRKVDFLDNKHSEHMVNSLKNLDNKNDEENSFEL